MEVYFCLVWGCTCCFSGVTLGYALKMTAGSNQDYCEYYGMLGLNPCQQHVKQMYYDFGPWT